MAYARAPVEAVPRGSVPVWKRAASRIMVGLNSSRKRPSPAMAEAKLPTKTSPATRSWTRSGWSAQSWPTTVPPSECPTRTAPRRSICSNTAATSAANRCGPIGSEPSVERP